jgi:hypothetical protein
MHGRTIKTSLYAGHPRPTFYIVAEPDRLKAIAILRAGIAGTDDVFEDAGHASEALLAALQLGPGQFRKA